MFAEGYAPITEGMAIPCSGRLTRRTALDSFDPGVWEKFKHCVLEQPTLTDEQQVTKRRLKDRIEKEEFLCRSFMWMKNLYNHRKQCETCHPKTGEHPFPEYEKFYHYPKAGPICTCITVSQRFHQPVEFCYACGNTNWKKWNRWRKVSKKEPEKGQIHHCAVVVTVHYFTWFMKTYHLRCALKIGLLPEEAFVNCIEDLKAMKAHVKEMTKKHNASLFLEAPLVCDDEIDKAEFDDALKKRQFLRTKLRQKLKSKRH